MSRSHAVREGFATVFRNPALYAAELAWRWCFGLAAMMLASWAILHYLNSLPVSDIDLFLLSGILPGSIKKALENIFSGSGPALLRTVTALVCGLGVLWMLAAASGRWTLLRNRFSASAAPSSALFRLYVMRLMLALAALGSMLAACLLAFDATMEAEHHRTAAFFLLTATACTGIWALWSLCAWVLSIAPVIAVRDNVGVREAIQRALFAILGHFSQFLWVMFIFLIARISLWTVGFSALMSALAIMLELPPEGAFIVFLMTLAGYSAVAAVLHVARISSYARILDWTEEKPVEASEAAPPPFFGAPPPVFGEPQPPRTDVYIPGNQSPLPSA